jgi:sulfur-carrier protein adenylyltransferase/sulfurtransferase
MQARERSPRWCLNFPYHEPGPEDMKTGAQLLEETRARIREVSAADAVGMRGDPNTIFLDVREPNEWNLGRIPGSVFIPRGNLESKVEAAIPREKKVVVYCARGNRSAFAAETLTHMGYDAVSLRGGWGEWVGAGGDVES